MTVAPWLDMIGTVFRIRWFLTVRLLELALRVVVLSAIFRRPPIARR